MEEVNNEIVDNGTYYIYISSNSASDPRIYLDIEMDISEGFNRYITCI